MTQPRPHPDGTMDLLSSYVPQRGCRDEMLAPDGRVTAVWQDFIDHLARLTPDQLTRRFARGDQYLRDAGVLYRQYDDTLSTEREWPLSHVPVIIAQAEWDRIAAGLVERAELLEYVVRDFYGANHLVASGQLPATLLAQNPAWLRPMIGAQPASAGGPDYLTLLSFEIGRGPNGQWWVISDLVEAPSTMGFALENRMAMSRTFPNFFAGSNILRLAGFFQGLQHSLFHLRGRAGGEIALLTPGPMNQSYAEHAYIARYLGLLLVEGEDLVVQNGQAMVRTVAGPKPVSLLWNRLPGAMTDPLELDPDSMLGTPGLLDALRAHHLKTLNAVGAGVLETRALMAFLPQIARQRLGRDLALPNIATWWCGDPDAAAHVSAHADRMMVGSAFSTVPLMADPATQLLEDQVRSSGRQAMQDMLARSGRDLVGQEAVTLSTTPIWQDGGLVARPMSIRVFLARTPRGWTVMPGGYARVSAGQDAKALAMQRGGKVADVWVVSPDPVDRPSLLGEDAAQSRQPALQVALPSRAADNLFWLGRYVERSELNMRIFRAYYARLGDGATHETPLLVWLRERLMQGVAPEAGAMTLLFDAPLSLGLQSARRISDRFSPDGMMALRGLVDNLQALKDRPVPPEDIPREISALLRQITGFSGLVHENMYRSDGWRFLSLGLSIERAANMCDVLAQLTDASAPEGALDLAIEIGDSVVTHRARFSIQARRQSVLDLLGADDQNPRSVRYHVARARRHVDELPAQDRGHVLTGAASRALMLETRLATTALDGLTPEVLGRIRLDLWDLSDSLSASHLV
ncbi:MAG: circularly permuted type 2 ATP-grasp protein [Paracoccaceae bacterium]